ncbi:hypothetical protein [Salinicola salarius]|uniref:hypothetical protein n=1 Tax=Salinicola salarius TaxID=430457 RepID=UPI000DA1EDBD|nr:hypothetical protein [Salinicola salarius]
MKVIGGSFGTSGAAHISRDNTLVVKSGQKYLFKPGQVENIDTRTESVGGFHAGKGLLAILILGYLGLMLLGLVGAFFGLLLGLGIGFIKEKRNVADLDIEGGKRLTLECSPKAIQWLLEFKG